MPNAEFQAFLYLFLPKIKNLSWKKMEENGRKWKKIEEEKKLFRRKWKKIEENRRRKKVVQKKIE